MKTLRRTTMSSAAWLACTATLLFSQALQAETTFRFSGYGTLAGTITDSTDYTFRSSMSQSEGANKGFDFFTDSKLGLQGVANFGNGLSFTGQVLGQRRRETRAVDSNNDMNLGFEWLYAQYSPTVNLDLRAGRVVLPAFMISDSRNVGYSQSWLRAPMVVYAGMPLTNLDGVQVNWRIPVGSAIVTLQPTYGRSNINIQSGPLVLKERSRYVGGLNLVLEYGDWMVRAGRVRSKIPHTQFAPFGDQAGGIEIEVNDTFTSAGLQYDNGQAVVLAEWTQRKMDPDMPLAGNPIWGFITPPGFPVNLGVIYATQFAGQPLIRSDAFYVAGGWRFGSVLPMVSYGQTKNFQTQVKTREISASVRWDFMSSVALKAQWSRFNARDGQAFVSSVQDNTSPDWDKKINVFSIGLDFVF